MQGKIGKKKGEILLGIRMIQEGRVGFIDNCMGNYDFFVC
jgi:hypothetical protein